MSAELFAMGDFSGIQTYVLDVKTAGDEQARLFTRRRPIRSAVSGGYSSSMANWRRNCSVCIRKRSSGGPRRTNYDDDLTWQRSEPGRTPAPIIQALLLARRPMRQPGALC